jgi:2EXR family
MQDTGTAQALPASPVVQDDSFPFFSRLPVEIRLMIWRLTLSPRVINLKVYQARKAQVFPIPLLHPARSSSAVELDTPSQQRHQSNTDYTCFTATLGLVEPPASNYDHGYLDIRSQTFTAAMNASAPLGPAALYVCHESRTTALKQYELAFGGRIPDSNVDTAFANEWEAAGCGKKKIWVDFKHDMIYVELLPLQLPTRPLDILAEVAREESMKIRRLAVSKRCPTGWTSRLGRGLPRRRLARMALWWRTSVLDGIIQFESLKELELYCAVPFQLLADEANLANPEELAKFKADLLVDLETEMGFLGKNYAVTVLKRRYDTWKNSLLNVEIRRGFICDTGGSKETVVII